MENELNETELNELREIFSLVDRDGSGSITKDELGELLHTLGIDTNAVEIDMMIHEIDADDDGQVDFKEFVAVMSKKVSTDYTNADVKAAFRLLSGESATSTKNQHVISLEQLQKSIFTFSSGKLSWDQCLELTSQLEVDNQGMVNYNDYVNMMMLET